MIVNGLHQRDWACAEREGWLPSSHRFTVDTSPCGRPAEKARVPHFGCCLSNISSVCFSGIQTISVAPRQINVGLVSTCLCPVPHQWGQRCCLRIPPRPQFLAGLRWRAADIPLRFRLVRKLKAKEIGASWRPFMRQPFRTMLPTVMVLSS